MTEINDRKPGFAERERLAERAWGSFSSTRDMSHDFRAGYHRGLIDGYRMHRTDAT